MNSFKIFFKNLINHKAKLDYLWFLLIPILNINYLITGRLYLKGYDIALTLDRALPLISFFIIPYIFWYLFIPIGLLSFLFDNRLKYMKVFLSILAGMITCYVIYVFFPTEYVRPTIENTGVFNKLIIAIYSNDKPFNCFPSIHVLTTYLIMRSTSYSMSKPFFIYTQIAGLLIIISTLFIKQHFVLDIFAAIILSEIIILVMSSLSSSIFESVLSLPRKIIFYRKNRIAVEDTGAENI